MNSLIFSVFICLITIIECAKRTKRDMSDYISDTNAPLERINFTPEERVEQFLKTMQSFEAFNLKQKYELGRTVAQIIHSMRLEKNGGVTAKKAKISSMEQADVEADVIDKNPEESWRIAETYIKAYKGKTEKAGKDQLQSGWSAIKTRLRDEPVYVRSKVLIRAIADEEVALVKRLVTELYSVANIEKYTYAVRVYKEKGTVKSEEIVDFLEKKNSELGAAVSVNDKLQSGWDQVQVHEYIYDNNYPMLRRALDAGFDHDFVYEKSGSLLGLSVVARCYRCVKMLVERGADVNAPILLENDITLKGWEQSVSVKGWTPLMVAVADGNVRIVAELIESGSAMVSKTGNEQEEPRFHARAVARRIKDEELRMLILGILKLTGTEYRELSAEIQDKDFVEALKSDDMEIVDAFLLMRPNLDYSLDQIAPIKKLSEPMSKLLRFECIKRY